MEKELSELITQALKGSADFETVETLVRDASLRIGAGMLETLINADRGDCRPAITHPDGTVMEYAGRREKTFVTVLGDMTLARAYYTDAHGRGYFPRDTVLGLDTDSLSAGVKRIIGHTASILSFQESRLMIEHLAALRITTKQVERAAEILGEEIAAREQSVIADGIPCSKTMYLGIDGTGCPVRKEET